MFEAGELAAFLTSHFSEGSRGAPDCAAPAGRADAYRVQDLVVDALGGACGWKVGCAADCPEPYCAPIPLVRRFADGCAYARHRETARLEAELGFRLAEDVPRSDVIRSRSECGDLIDAIVPAIEILETRLTSPQAELPLWKLSDLQANGGLVVGSPIPWAGQDIRKVMLTIETGEEKTTGERAHPFGDPLDLFCWTLNHVCRHRSGLRKGDVVITGSYCGIVEIIEPRPFRATFAGFGNVGLDVA